MRSLELTRTQRGLLHWKTTWGATGSAPHAAPHSHRSCGPWRPGTFSWEKGKRLVLRPEAPGGNEGIVVAWITSESVSSSSGFWGVIRLL